MKTKTTCWGCYETLENQERFHVSCSQKLFGVRWVPSLSLSNQDFIEVAREMAGQMSISGVQPKVSVQLNKKEKALLAAPTGGEFILKPQNQSFPYLPENEDLCMHLAADFDLEVPPHGLMRSKDGRWVYLIRRFDRRLDGTKLAVEDFGQALGVLTRSKYDLSYEKIAKGVLQHCTNSYLELSRLFERLLFCFVIGNGDMHLKNFSLLTEGDGTIRLAPVYDYLSSKLVLPREEDLALNLNGKKNRIKRKDFEIFSKQIGLEVKVMQNIFDRLFERRPVFFEKIGKSFLPEDQKALLEKILKERFSRL